MNYTHLGRTGLKVSRLCLGTMNFGDVTDEKTSARILDEALEAGINFIITNSQPAKTDDFFRISKRRNCPVSKTMSLPMVEPAIHNHFCMINVRIWSRRIKSVRSGITINFE